MQLRPYQENDVAKVSYEMRKGNRRVILQAPCGYGKTILSAELARRAIEKGKTVRFLVHRRDLCTQTYDKFNQYGLGEQTGLILSGHESHLGRPIQIGTVQTYSRRLELDDLQYNRWFKDDDLVIPDEVHMFGAPTYKAILDVHKNAYILGLSATPYRRGTGFGLGNLFDVLVPGEPMHKLIEAGYLLKPIHYSSKKPDERLLDGDILENWCRLSPDKSTIIFAKSVSHSKAIMNRFRNYGISICHIDSHTPDEEREVIYAGVNSGEIQVLTNCNVCTEGSDLPRVQTVVIAKNVTHLPKYLQMAGRPARPFDGQKECFIIDHSGCVSKFGLVDDNYSWTLDSKVVAAKNVTKERKKKPITCEKCSHLFYYQEKCPMCLTPVVIKNQFVETTDENLVRVGKNRKRKETVDEIKRWFGMFLTHANDKGYKYGWAIHKWADKFKIPFESKYKSDPVEIDEAFLNYMVHLNIRNAHWRKKNA